MITRAHKHLSIGIVLALLLCPTMLSAQEDGEESRSVIGMAEDVDSGQHSVTANERLEPTQISELTREVAEDAWQAQQQAEAAEDKVVPKRKGFGRWLKKHWYVPVLAGVAIGAAVSDDGSDGPDDVED